MCGNTRLPPCIDARLQQQQQQPALPHVVLPLSADLEHARRALSSTCSTPPGASPPLSPRSACSTPGRAHDRAFGGALPALFAHKAALQHARLAPLLAASKHGAPLRVRTSTDLRRSHEAARPAAAAAATAALYGAGSGSAAGSACGSGGSLVHALASLGLEGAGRAPRATAGGTRGCISKAKQVLAEALSSVHGAHNGCGDGFAPSAADTGVLSPLLSIIRNNGASQPRRASLGEPAAAPGGGRVSRRASFSEASSSSGRSRSVTRRASFSEAAGGLNGCALGEGGVPASALSASSSRPGSAARMARAGGSGSSSSSGTFVAECIDTVRFLAQDDANRMALIDLGALELLLCKLQKHGASSSISIAGAGDKPGSGAAAVVEAALTALPSIAKHDATKLRLWEHPYSAALLGLLAARRAAPAVRAAHLAVAQLAWSVDLCADGAAGAASSSGSGSGSSSVFDSVSSHLYRDDSSVSSSSCCGAHVLLAPALVPALAGALHPGADVPVLLSLLKMLTKAAGSSCLELAPGSPHSTASVASSDGSSADGGRLCTAQNAQNAAWRCGWKQAVFALPPLLVPNGPQGGRVLGAALDLLVALSEARPELHGLVCAAGCLPPLLALLLAAPSERCLQAACVLNALADCPAALDALGREPSLAVLLRAAGDGAKSPDARLSCVHLLRRLAGAVPSAGRQLKALGAVSIAAGLLHDVHDPDVRRAIVGLLQLLGTEVVVRPRRPRHGGASDGGAGGWAAGAPDSPCELRHACEPAAGLCQPRVLHQQQQQPQCAQRQQLMQPHHLGTVLPAC